MLLVVGGGARVEWGRREEGLIARGVVLPRKLLWVRFHSNFPKSSEIWPEISSSRTFTRGSWADNLGFNGIRVCIRVGILWCFWVCTISLATNNKLTLRRIQWTDSRPRLEFDAWYAINSCSRVRSTCWITMSTAHDLFWRRPRMGLMSPYWHFCVRP